MVLHTQAGDDFSKKLLLQESNTLMKLPNRWDVFKWL